jgi:hypothetical protein
MLPSDRVSAGFTVPLAEHEISKEQTQKRRSVCIGNITGLP